MPVVKAKILLLSFHVIIIQYKADQSLKLKHSNIIYNLETKEIFF